MKKMVLKVGKISGIAIGGILLLLFLLPILFPGRIEEQIKRWTNQTITGELNFKKVRLSFFEHFPALTLTLHDFTLKGAAPFEKDTLIAGKALSFGIDLSSVFGESIRVNKFFVDKAIINIEIDQQGNPNYAIYKGSKDSTNTAKDSNTTKLKIEGIYITKSQLRYNDRTMPMLIVADGFRYTGKGQLDNADFDLDSKLHADSLSFSYDGTTYLRKRKIDAALTTGINTSSLSLKFKKNNIRINKLPVDFSGNMTILKEGYDIDLKLVSGTTDFGNLFSILPPDYEQWFASTSFKGTSRLTLDLKGAYRAAEGKAPNLVTKLFVRNGQIRHDKAPAPLDQVNIVASLTLPALNADSLTLQVDTLGFYIGSQPTSGTLYSKGLSRPYIKADLNSQIDLALLDQAIGLPMAAIKGKLNLQLKAEGNYFTGQNPKNFRPDTILLSIPNYQLNASLQQGYYKQKDLPLAVTDLSADIQSACTDAHWENISLTISKLNALLGKGSLNGRIQSTGLMPAKIDADIKARLQLDDINKAIPLQGYSFAGKFMADIVAKGTLDNNKKQFPATRALLQWEDGRIQTPYYPAAIENIHLDGTAQSASGSYKDLGIEIAQLNFRFENQPFTMTAKLADASNLHYAITAKGTLDLTRIYQVFAIDQYSVKGKLGVDLVAKGNQADALAGRYASLANSGRIEFDQLELYTKEYPAPFLIPSGTISFNQDKAWLKNTLLQYQQNTFNLNGYAQNFIGYALLDQVLLGNLQVSSKKIVVDDFMAFAGSDSSTTAAGSGVVLLPTNLNLQLNAKVDAVQYGSTVLNNFAGQLVLNKGQLQLTDTKFQVAGGTFNLAASYAPLNPQSANFSFTVKADSFDVKRAYKEIPLFREMASAAGKAAGRISLNYSLDGRLNDQMAPVMPSIKGSGELTLADVQVSGLKLFSAVSKATGKDSLNNPNLKAVVLKSSIKNNLITLQRTKMRIFGFRPRIEGQTSLDGKLNLRFRLGLPPLGIIGIPMTVTGTADNPIVKMRKGNAADELQEEADPDSQ